jgi:hypothetical protein
VESMPEVLQSLKIQAPENIYPHLTANIFTSEMLLLVFLLELAPTLFKTKLKMYGYLCCNVENVMLWKYFEEL